MQELLEDLGLNRTESTVLLSLLESGASSAALVAKRTDLKRTTVYSALAELERLALVHRLKRESRTLFVSLDANELSLALESQAKEALRNSLQTIELLKPRLEQFPTQARHTVGGYQVTYTRTLKGALTILEQSLKYDYCGIFNPEMALEGEFGKVGRSALKANKKTKPKIRDIAIEGPKVDNWRTFAIGNPNHQIRTIKGDRALYTDLLLTQGTVNLFNYNLDEPMVIQIQHPDYYRFMMMIFDELWNGAQL